MAKTALITGITGQDGYYMAEFLHEKGYEVYGLVRRSSLNIEQRLGKLAEFVKVEHGDLTDSLSLREVLSRVQPDEIYNLAAQSHVGWTFKTPERTRRFKRFKTIPRSSRRRPEQAPIVAGHRQIRNYMPAGF